MKKKLPIFKSREGRAKYIKAYEEMFSLWDLPLDPIEVKTKFGLTHINAIGPDDGDPLVLLHGAGLSSTVWFANIAALSTNRRVYAVDTIGDAGKSVAERLLDKPSDYAEWLKEVLDGLNLEKCDMLGHSYGGWVTLNLAIADPNRIRKLVLLAPAASFIPLGYATKLFLHLGEFNIGPPAKNVLKMIASKGTVLEEKFIHLMNMTTRYCRSATIFPTVFTDAELKRINLPTLFIIGCEDKIYNRKKAIARAQRWLPDLSAEIIPNAGHLLIMDQPDLINEWILNFLDHS